MRKNKKIIFSIILLLFLLSLYKSDKIMIEIPQQLTDKIYAVSGLDLLPHWQKFSGTLFRLEDNLNPFRFKKNLLDGTMPVYNLELSANDLRHFDNLSKTAIMLGYLPNDQNKWRSAKLRIDGKDYAVEARFHGDSPFHWSKSFKSYQIKTEKEDFINRMRRFNLIVFEDRLFTAKTARILSKYFGLQDVRDDIVILRINGVNQGIYYLQEKTDKEFLEYNRCSNCYAIRLSDNWVEDHPYNVPPYYGSDENGVVWGTGHMTPFDYEIANLDVEETIPSSKSTVQYRVKQFFDMVKKDDPNVINYFDLDYLASFEAFRMIIGNVHLIAGDNFRIIYRATNGKFYPIPESEHFYNLERINGGFDHYLNTFDGRPVRLFYLLYQNDNFRNMRNRKVYDFVTNNTVLEDYDKLMEKYQPYTLSYKTNDFNTRHIKQRLRNDRDKIKSNMNLIKENLEYSKAYINIVQRGNSVVVEIIPDSISPISLDKLRFNLTQKYSGSIKMIYTNPHNITQTSTLTYVPPISNFIDVTEYTRGLEFSAGVDENLYPSRRPYYLNFTFLDLDIVSINYADIIMKNDISGQIISPHDTYVQIADANNFIEIERESNFQHFRSKYSEFKWSYNGSHLTLHNGDYRLSYSLIVPAGLVWNIEAGTTIYLDENINILSLSPINILGEENAPVTIEATDKSKPFGTFAVVGDGKGTSYINWLDLSGGNEAWINGMYFSGQMAINHMDVVINNTKIHRSKSDDGINIKYSDIFVENSDFFDNAADQVDMDFVTGTVKDSRFTGRSGGIGGDTLDLSGSEVLVIGNKFSDSADKGVSIGEETEALLYGNEISNNNIGVAVKDLSNAYFVKNTFNNNNEAISVYQKKELFGPGFAYVGTNDFSNNGKKFSNDKNSKIYELNSNSETYKNSLRKYADQIVAK